MVPSGQVVLAGTRRAPVSEDAAHLRVAVVGAGFGGLGAAIRLSQEGIDDPDLHATTPRRPAPSPLATSPVGGPL
jgi:succinate dehydrogenase/fumarate reductase flavoprotein subunit